MLVLAVHLELEWRTEVLIAALAIRMVRTLHVVLDESNRLAEVFVASPASVLIGIRIHLFSMLVEPRYLQNIHLLRVIREYEPRNKTR